VDGQHDSRNPFGFLWFKQDASLFRLDVRRPGFARGLRAGLFCEPQQGTAPMRGKIPFDALWLFAVFAIAQRVPAHVAFEDGLKAHLRKLTTEELPGIAVLVARDGKIAFQAGFGFADLEKKTPATIETKFRIGSVTKQFTAAAILRLAEDRKLGLDDKLDKFFPAFPRGNEITLHHLLTHTSGIRNVTKMPGFYQRVSRYIAPAKLVAWFGHEPPDFPPGTGSPYSNSGYFLLGQIVERVAGKSLEAFLRETFFEPLAMNNTGILVNAAPPPGLATGYSMARGKATLALPWDMSWTGGAGGLYSTVGDLFRWNEALFGGKVVNAESFKLMLAPVNLPPESVNYGYGVAMVRLHQLASVSHGGSQDGWASYLARLPEQQCTVVVLANADPSVAGRAPTEVTYDIAGKLLAADIAKLPPSSIWGKLWRDLRGK
jgi:CubicO group peptidase (beta-lactamase class C family)